MLNQQPPLDLAFQALADANRRRMLERLSAGEATVSDLAQPFAMSLPAVMQHLAVLENAGLVMSEKVGRVRTIRLQHQALDAVAAWLAARRQEWHARFGRLEAYLNTMQEGKADDSDA